MHILLLILVLAFNFSANARESAIEAVDKNNLRVCADPSNLPFSNENGEGFENDIAELLGKKLNIRNSQYLGTLGRTLDRRKKMLGHLW